MLDYVVIGRLCPVGAEAGYVVGPDSVPVIFVSEAIWSPPRVSELQLR
jgi:hypothetical protein